MRRAIAFFVALTFLTVPGRSDDDPEFNGRKMSEWLIMLKGDSVPRKRKAAAVALGQIASDQKDMRKFVLPALASAVRSDPAPAVRSQAAGTIGQQPPEYAGAFVSELAECLRTERDTAVKIEVAVALGRIGKLAKAGVLPLSTLLADPDAGVRAAAAEALGRIGSDAKSAGPALLAALKDADANVRRFIIFALGRVEPDDIEPVVAAFVGLLKGNEPREIRFETVVALGLMVPKTAAVATAVAGTLTDADVETRRQACLTLSRLGVVAKASEPSIRAALTNDEDKDVRSFAVRALTAAYGSDAADTIPLLVERLKADPDFEVRVALADELGSFGRTGAPAVPALRAAMRDPQIKVRDAATAAVKQIERPAPKPANP